MDGRLKALVASACVVVIAGGAWYASGEYSKSQAASAQRQRLHAAALAEAERQSSPDYIKCRDSLHSSALGEPKRLRDWCRQNGFITYDEQLRAEGVAQAN
jgi:hypothetical protein